MNDTSGVERDIVMGYNTALQYQQAQEKFGGVPGPYVNRIQILTFNLTMDNVGQQFHVASNYGNNTDTNDGGPNG